MLTDEQIDAERKAFIQWCQNQGTDAELWMVNQPQCGFSNARVNDYWTGYLARAVLAATPAPAMQPAAWTWDDNDGICGSPLTHYSDCMPQHITNATPLYAAPVVQESDEALLRKCLEAMRECFRLDTYSDVCEGQSIKKQGACGNVIAPAISMLEARLPKVAV